MKNTLVTLIAAALMAMAITSCQHKYTAKMENMNDTVSYVIGVTQSNGLIPFLNQAFELDSAKTDNVIKGITQVAQATSDAQRAECLGISYSVLLKKQLLKSLNYRLFGDDATQSLNEEIFFDVFNKVAKGDSVGMNAMEANFYASTMARRIVIDTLEVTPAICDSLSMAYAVENAENFVNYLKETYQLDDSSVDFVLATIQNTAKNKSESKWAEYIGVNVGLQIVDNLLPMAEKEFFAMPEDFNRDNFFAAFFASMRGEDLLIDEMESGAIMRREGEKILAQRMETEYAENKAAGIAFLEENKKQEGVQVTASGLQYMVLKEGKGDKPAATDKVKVHYHGTLIDGTVFDSSVARETPAEFPLNAVISGWTEGLQLMSKGAKYRFYIPQELGYGAQDRGMIKPFSVLIFDVELLEIVK